MLAFSFKSYAQDHSQDIENLKVILKDVEASINNRDLETALKHLHKDCYIIFQNGEIVKKHSGIIAFNDKMFKGENAILKNHSATASVDDDALFYNENTTTAHGTVIDKFSFMDGVDMEVKSKWSASLIKENDQWQVISLSFSANIFDNPVLNNIKKVTKYFAAASFLLGVISCLIAVRLLRRKA